MENIIINMDKIKIREADMVNDIKITFCAYFAKIDAFRYESEIYSEYTAFCLYNGCFAYKIGASHEKILSANEFVICPPGEPFYRRVIDSCELFMIKFKIIGGAVPSTDPISVHDVLRYRQDLDNLRDCIFCRDMEDKPLHSHYAKDVIYMSNHEPSHDTRLSKVESMIKSGSVSGLRVDELAKASGYTTVHFINLFKKRYGCTPGEYVAEQKVKRAVSLLLRTDKPSRDIALECGFSDELYFIRFFKKHTGMTPTEYRRAHLESTV